MFPDNLNAKEAPQWEEPLRSEDAPQEYQGRSAKAAEASRQGSSMSFFNAFVALGTTVSVIMLFLWLMNLIR
ncbi:hypothetical protein J2Z22_002788 [Paenibacillus forsythiae]|uniref:Uncharacterized protein n=1 Tax=Paenibacillus forsythiae TaxID=365616 RepID=A0ABU3H8U9_9BACL|nr:hypothetical protein [Paenibacillus forsythiae]MDT3427237.1 hypothetical protein [Paenibacillus forsythiae]